MTIFGMEWVEIEGRWFIVRLLLNSEHKIIVI